MSSVDRLAEAELPYALEFEESSNILYGVVKAPIEPPPASADPAVESTENSADFPRRQPAVTGFGLRQHVEKRGYQDFFFPKNSLNGFVKAINEKSFGRYILGYRKNATIEIAIASGALSATAKTTRAWGGTALTKEMILNEIRRNRIAPERIIKQALGELFDDTQGIQVTLALALQPVPGENAKLQPLLSSQILKDRDPDSSDSIDQREMFEFVVVDAGTPLLKKTPLTKGTPGADVVGREIKSVPGKDVQFAKPFEGVEPSAGDENILIASIKGHPVFFQNGVKVDPILSLPSVNINSGNVDYDGSVFIKDNVENGFIVKATGDIHVKGQVERACLSAGGSIYIHGGVLGSEKENEEYSARLSCQGDLSAKFLSQTAVECGGSVIVAEYIMHSHVKAIKEVLVGQERGRGCIIGGHCHSESGITAKILGTEAYVPTLISAGSKEEYEVFLRLESEHRRRTEEALQLTEVLESITASGSEAVIGKLQLDKAQKINDVLVQLRQRITSLEEKLERYTAFKENNLRINVTDKVYPNTTVTIAGISWLCKQMASRKSIVRTGDQISILELNG